MKLSFINVLQIKYLDLIVVKVSCSLYVKCTIACSHKYFLNNNAMVNIIFEAVFLKEI